MQVHYKLHFNIKKKYYKISVIITTSDVHNTHASLPAEPTLFQIPTTKCFRTLAECG